MKNNSKNDLIQWALRAGVCLFMLSGTCILSAQEDVTDETDAPVVRKEKKIVLPKYEMKQISGVVYDAATRQPMAGVRVQALNNKLYTAMTDEKGAYTISVPKFVSVLYVMVPDYNPVQIAIKGAANQNVNMYGSQFKSLYKDGTKILSSAEMSVDNTSAISVENDIENQLNGSVRTIMKGGIPGQGAVMLINGLNSLNSTSQPLVVVDGVIWDMQYDRQTQHTGFYNNVLNLIDPEDIADVQVMKNGTSLYGAKGSNGVLLINTRRGKSMATRIRVRAYGGFETAPSTMKVMGGDQYRGYISELVGTTDLAKNAAGTVSIPFLNEDPSYPFYAMFHNNTDWSKDLYQTAFTQNYKVNVEGGDEVAMYNLSLGYTASDATAKKTAFDRLNIRFNTDIQLLDRLSTKMDIAYTRSYYDLRDNGWAESYATSNISSPNVLGLIQAPFLSKYAYFTQWDPVNKRNILVHSDNIYAGKNYSDSNNPFTFAQSLGTDALVNPYWVLQNGDGNDKNSQEATQFSVNIQPRLELGNHFVLSNRFSYILNRASEKYYLPYNGTPEKVVDGLGTVTSTIKSQFSKEISVFNDFRLDFEKHFKDHHLRAFAGFRIASYTFSDSYIKGYNNQNDKLPNLSYGLQYLSYGGANDTWTNLSYYLNAAYNYKNRYFLNGDVTMEASSRFGKEAKEGIKMFGVKWGLFPSIQAGWVLSSEPWFDVKAINYLKLTAGYEESGNDNIDYYAARTYFENIKFLDKATGLALANIQNPAIQWETNRRFNVGLETNLLDNRLHLGFEFYKSTISNLLVKKKISYITGLSSIWTNDGKMENNGLEVNVSGVLVNTKNFSWQAGFSLGHYKNKIKSLPTSDEIKLYQLDELGHKTDKFVTVQGYTSSVYGTDNVLTAVGEAAGVFYGYQTAGVFATDGEAQNAGKLGYLRYPTGLVGQEGYRSFRAGDVHFVDQNGDGWITEADKVKIGDPNPDIYGNIFTSFTWKKFRLDFNFKYSLGNDVFNYQRSMLESGNNCWNQSTALMNRWTYSGQQTDVPRLMATSGEEWVNNERFSDRWVEDGSYLKLKKVRLTYSLPLSLSWLQGVSVWGEANNVFTITKYLGNDPEVLSGNGVLYQGIDAGYLPQNRNFNIGVTINL